MLLIMGLTTLLRHRLYPYFNKKNNAPTNIGLWNIYFLIKILLIFKFIYTPALGLNALLLILILTLQFLRKKIPCRPWIAALPLILLALWILKLEISFYHPKRIAVLIEMFGPVSIKNYAAQLIHFFPVSQSVNVILSFIVLILGLSFFFDLSLLTYTLIIFSLIQFIPQSIRAERAYQSFQDQQKAVLIDSSPHHRQSPLKIIFIQICSLSTDDVYKSNLKTDDFWKEFDWVSWNFNTTASYSELATHRLMRSLCGQTTMENLTRADSSDSDCLLTNFLEKDGFTLASHYDHEGKNYSFAALNEQISHLPNPSPLTSGERIANDTNGAPIYPASVIFNKAISDIKSHSRQFIYFNSIFLHKGVQGLGPQFKKNTTEVESFKMRFKILTQEASKLFRKIEESKEPALIIFVGEHGYPLSREWPQIGGVRDIPVPKVTTVPLAIKLIQGTRPKDLSLFSSQPISNLAVGWLTTKFADNPEFFFNPHQSWTEELVKLSPTLFVSESYHWVAIQLNDKTYFRNQEGKIWWVLPHSSQS